MNGTIFDEIKKKDHSKKKEQLKLFTVIFLTNTLVALTSWAFFSNSPSLPMTKPVQKIFHPHHKTIIATLTVLVETDAKATEIPITLMNKNKKILIARAYLHEEVQPKKGEEMGSTRFRIEIPEEEIFKVSEEILEPMIAIPEVKLNRQAKAVSTKVSKYEMVF